MYASGRDDGRFHKSDFRYYVNVNNRLAFSEIMELAEKSGTGLNRMT